MASIAHLEMASETCIDVSVIFSTPITTSFAFSHQYFSLHLQVFRQPSMEEDDRASDDYSIDSESHFTEERGRHSRHAYARRLRALRGPTLAWKQLNRSQFLRNRNVSWWTKVLLSLTLFAVLLWVLLLYILIPRIRSAAPVIRNGFQEIASNWVMRDSANSARALWPKNLSGGIKPVPVHSHNDYTRHVPIFDALAVGCESVEADIWHRNNDLLVGHSENSLSPERTLRSMYIDPLARILEQQNKDHPAAATSVGVFDSSPSTSLILLIDMKSYGFGIWSALSAQLEPLREKGLLTIHNGSALVPGPITIVGTGNTPFELVLNMTNRDIFFDAPLASLSLGVYNATNSYYASSSLGAAVGKTWFGRLSSRQLRTVEAQTQLAREFGLIPRYWDTPAWPISWRNRVWSDLVTHGIGEGGFLNADDVVTASRWDWSWCSVLGVNVC